MVWVFVDIFFLAALIKPLLMGVDWKFCALLWAVFGVVLTGLFATLGSVELDLLWFGIYAVVRLAMGCIYFFLLHISEGRFFFWVTLVFGTPLLAYFG